MINDKTSKIIKDLWQDPDYKEKQLNARKNMGDKLERKKQEQMMSCFISSVKNEFRLGKQWDVNKISTSLNITPEQAKELMKDIQPEHVPSNDGEELIMLARMGQQLVDRLTNDYQKTKALENVRDMMVKTDWSYTSKELKELMLDRGFEVQSRYIAKELKKKDVYEDLGLAKVNNKYSIFHFNVEKSFPVLLKEFAETHPTFTSPQLSNWLATEYPDTFKKLADKYPQGSRFNYNSFLGKQLKKCCEIIEDKNGRNIWSYRI